MRKPLPNLEDIIDTIGGGIYIPSIHEVFNDLGFKTDNIGQRKIFSRNTTHEHKSYKNIKMITNSKRDEVKFFNGKKLIYTAPTLYYCYKNKKEIIRELNISALI